MFHGPAEGRLQFQLERVYPVLLANEFARGVLPYLTECERSALRPVVLPFIRPDSSTSGNPVFGAYVAALLGMSEELLALASSWPDNDLARFTDARNLFNEPHRLLFGLADVRQVQHQMRRLKGYLITPFLIRGWLAHTELAGLDLLRDSILVQNNKKLAELLLAEVGALVRAPELAPLMLQLQRDSKASAIARQWLDDNLGLAATGLQSTAAGQGKLAGAAEQFLHDARLKGGAEEAAPAPETTARTPAPEWLTSALAGAARGKIGLPSWVDPVVFPPIQAGDCILDTEQVRALLESLHTSEITAPSPWWRR